MAVNVRVILRDAKHSPGASPEERKREDKEAFDGMFRAFKTKVIDSKVEREFKRKQYFESKGEKRRRKFKESRIQKLKNSRGNNG